MQVSEQLKDSLEDLKDSIQIYDAVVKTGNEVLDVVLTEKNFYCQANHITMACIVDGAKMDFMETMDVYALLQDFSRIPFIPSKCWKSRTRSRLHYRSGRRTDCL